jgi:MoaA/NifB/PqqE/SkfB family radical SAM enzyme
MVNIITYKWSRFKRRVYRLLIKKRKLELIIETSAICNARCVWCWIYNANKVKPGLMSLEYFKKIIDVNENFLKKGGWLIQPFFRGEALMNPRLFDMLDYLVNKEIDLSYHFDTNLSVQIDVKRLMGFPWKEIRVNLGGITKEVHEKVMRNTNFELVLENLKEMLKINKDIVYLKVNPTKYNIHQIDKLRDFFVSIGGRPDKVMPYTTAFIIPHAASIEEKKYFFDNVVSENVEPYLRFEYDLTKNDFGIKAKVSGCKFLIPSITFDGEVTVCSHDQMVKINVGNAFTTPLKTIFNSREYRTAIRKGRRQEFYFCKECN